MFQHKHLPTFPIVIFQIHSNIVQVIDAQAIQIPILHTLKKTPSLTVP